MDENLRCPCETCSGWVCKVDQGIKSTFFGCGECGAVWFRKEDLDLTISKAIARRDYRAKVYLQTDRGYVGIDINNEPDDYEELVVKEWS